MSRENVEIVRTAFEAVFQSGEVPSALRENAPTYEGDLSRMVGPLRGVYRADEAKRVFVEFALAEAAFVG